MSGQHWIWHKNEFEIFLHKRMMLRRQERLSKILPCWLLDSAYDCMVFSKSGENKKDIWLKITARGSAAIKIDNNPTYIENTDSPIFLPAGKHSIRVEIYNPGGLPCIYVEGEGYESNETWLTNSGNALWQAAACSDFNLKENCPEDYRLPVRRLDAAFCENLNDGILYDFGREVLGFPVLTEIKGNGNLAVYYGESRREALDTKGTEVYDIFTLQCEMEFISKESRAFRYIFLPHSESVSFGKIYCHEEYYPVKNRSFFNSNDSLLNKIYEDSLYTLEMTSREFYIDGVKRDRWVWAGDAYQSALMNYYTYFDKDIVKRTIIALLGKGKIDKNINTIMDYSFYLIITVYDYFLYTGDTEFVRDIYDRLTELLTFCLARRNKNGFMQKMTKDDWVFVDWADICNDGEVCAEQILLYKSLKSMAEFSEMLEKPAGAEFSALAVDLYKKLDVFWNDSAGCFAHDSTQNALTRYGSIFAVLYDVAGEKTQAIKAMLDKDEIQKIVTPFMKFFELSAVAELGGVPEMLEYIKSYWGGMLEEGTGTFWEQYDPEIKDERKYEMYGRPYGKSLCHSWGASPLYLIGRYLIGLKPVSPGYGLFELKPYLGKICFEAEMPVNNGLIYINYDQKTITVKAQNVSGVLIFEGRKIEITDGKEYIETVGEKGE